MSLGRPQLGSHLYHFPAIIPGKSQLLSAHYEAERKKKKKKNTHALHGPNSSAYLKQVLQGLKEVTSAKPVASSQSMDVFLAVLFSLTGKSATFFWPQNIGETRVPPAKLREAATIPRCWEDEPAFVTRRLKFSVCRAPHAHGPY